MSTPEDRSTPDSGEPQPPRWDAPPQAPAWDRPPEGVLAGYGTAPGYGSPAEYGPATGYGSPGEYGQQPPGYGGVPPQTESKAIIAFVLAIASFFGFPFIAAVIALFVAGAARRDIDASGGRLIGGGLVTAATITAWVNIALCVLAILFVVLAFGLFATTGFSEG